VTCQPPGWDGVTMVIKGWQNKLTAQAGEFLVCAELARRGLVATPFAGNVPGFDVLAADQHLRSLPVQVKTSSGDKWPTNACTWMDICLDEAGVQHDRGLVPLPDPHLIFVCVALRRAEGRDRFFVLEKQDLQGVCAGNYRAYMDKHGWKRPRKTDSFDCRYSVTDLLRFEDNWALVEERLRDLGANAAQPSQEG